MVQTKNYLKYSAAGKCNIVASVDANLSLNNNGLCFAAAVEDVYEYNKKTGELVISLFFRFLIKISPINHILPLFRPTLSVGIIK